MGRFSGVIREFRVHNTKSGTKAQLDRPHRQRSQATTLLLWFVGGWKVPRDADDNRYTRLKGSNAANAPNNQPMSRFGPPSYSVSQSVSRTVLYCTVLYCKL